MTLRDEQWLFVKDLMLLFEFCAKNGFEVTLGEAHRTQDQQDIYLKEGKTKVKHSKHMDRLAIDLFIFKDGKLLSELKDLKTIGEYWQGLSDKNRAGMFFQSFYDAPHFERNV